MQTQERTYNGWTNYETWAVKLWIDNEQGSYSYWEEAAQEILDDTDTDDTREERKREAVGELAGRLKDEHNEAMPELGASIWSDLLGAALSEVDWYEIAEALLDDKTPSDVEDN
jgi:hypothetical protein